MANPLFARVQAMCLSFPEAVELETWGEQTFRVRNKIFAMGHINENQVNLTCKALPGVQEMLVGANPDRFYVPPYTGHNGWIGIRLADEMDWDEMEELIEESYRKTAPKRLSAELDQGPSPN